jgi:hypothetical protein
MQSIFKNNNRIYNYFYLVYRKLLNEFVVNMQIAIKELFTLFTIMKIIAGANLIGGAEYVRKYVVEPRTVLC